MRTIHKIAQASAIIALTGLATAAIAGGPHRPYGNYIKLPDCHIGGVTTALLPPPGPPGSSGADEYHVIFWGNGLKDVNYGFSNVSMNICGWQRVHGFYDVAPDGNWFIDISGDWLLANAPIFPPNSGPEYCSIIVKQSQWTRTGKMESSCEWGPINVAPLLDFNFGLDASDKANLSDVKPNPYNPGELEE